MKYGLQQTFSFPIRIDPSGAYTIKLISTTSSHLMPNTQVPLWIIAIHLMQ